MAWLFKVDYLDYLWNFLHNFARIHTPHYATDKDNSGHIPTSGHLPMMGYHLLVTLTIFIVGTTKSALLYANSQTKATTVECVFGVFVTVYIQSHSLSSDYMGSDSPKPAQLKYILLYFMSTTKQEYSMVCNFRSCLAAVIKRGRREGDR